MITHCTCWYCKHCYKLDGKFVPLCPLCGAGTCGEPPFPGCTNAPAFTPENIEIYRKKMSL